jgi:VIT1/CCC1 family predicted Fe2+/Mn2+ transporter
VAPYLFAGGATAIVLSLAVSGVALAALGAGTALFTGRGLTGSAVRQLIIGYGAALVTFLVGKAVGVSLGG